MTDSKDILKKFVTTCTVTFKAFDYRCELAKSSATIWNFVATNNSGEKVYAVYCAPRLDKSKSLIKLARKKIKGNMRLVVVTQTHNEEELEISREDGYALVTLESLNKYGEEMIEIRAKEASSGEDSDALASSREKVF
ncbi:MAG: hypothetical protein CME70_23520 [Halobacteriovorax sp.]|nr:hypothetical protein [Halobacteriovorax sp.]|tara:strand:- start:149721 stop:150134 length:414 start_codon:yes stop_codon:yes gene_type:complete